MAFVSMFLAFLFIALIILGGMFFLGLILLIIGIIRRKNPKNQGKKSPIVSIVLGILLLLPPVGTGVFVAGVIIKDYVVSHRDYEVVTDEWRAHYVVPSKAVNDVTAQLLEAVNDNDRELMEKLFAKSARESLGFERQLDSFIENCPKGKAEISDENVVKGVNYDRAYKDTTESRYDNESIKVEIGGEDYYVYAYFCNKNEDSDEVGLIFFCLQNEKGYEEHFDFSGQTIACLIK